MSEATSSRAVASGSGPVTVRLYEPDGGTVAASVVLAHGAGTDQDHATMTTLASTLAGRGLRAVTFNYPYTERSAADGRRRPPNAAAVLLECHRRIVDWVRAGFGPPVFLAGRSMGGRIGTMLAAEGDVVAGVVAYAYPLHPAGRPERLRVEHLSSVPVPMLFFQGDRDVLATPELFDEHIRTLPNTTVVDLVGVDHSWRGGGRKPLEVAERAAETTAEWIAGLASSPRSQA